MSAIFTTNDHTLNVFLNPDGAYSSSGLYNGATLKGAIPMPDGYRCVILIDPDTNTNTVFENLLCIDRSGAILWKAKLPTSPDVFVDVRDAPEGLLAAAWSGIQVTLDELKRTFLK
jgi:hypothetical protein